MDELRSTLKEAFARQQSELGELASTRERLVRSALDARSARGANRAQLAAGIAATVLTVMVVGTFAYVRANTGLRHGPGVPVATPSPSASPTPLRQPLKVAADTPVILYHDPANYDQLDGITWDGKLSGKVDWNAMGAAANPAANLFATATEIHDRSGHVLASGTFGTKYFSGTWADDERHFCQMVPYDHLGANGIPATLQLVFPGSAPRDVAKVGRVYEQVVLEVAACSVRTDRAVVVQGFGNSPATAQYWVVQLSTGKVLWTHQFDIASPAVTVAASPDGQYIAENSAGRPSGGSTIYGPDGTMLVHLATRVAAFCWDDSYVVTDPGTGSGPVSLVRWHDGSVIWTGPGGEGFSLWQAAPQPDGASIAIGIRDPAHPQQSTDPRTAGFAPVDLYVIAADGHVIVQMNGIYW